MELRAEGRHRRRRGHGEPQEEAEHRGWVVKDTCHDNSPDKALNPVADNDSKETSVWIVAYGKRDTPSLGIEVTSGCCQVPEGQTVDHF